MRHQAGPATLQQTWSSTGLGEEGSGNAGTQVSSPYPGHPEIRRHSHLPSRAGPGRGSDPGQREGALSAFSPQKRWGHPTNQPQSVEGPTEQPRHSSHVCTQHTRAHSSHMYTHVHVAPRAACTGSTRAPGNTPGTSGHSRFLDLVSERAL